MVPFKFPFSPADEAAMRLVPTLIVIRNLLASGTRPLFLTIVVLSSTMAAPSPADAAAEATPKFRLHAELEVDALAGINLMRAGYGLPPVELVPTVGADNPPEAEEWLACFIGLNVTENGLTHDRERQCGPKGDYSEQILVRAGDFPISTVSIWYMSPGHLEWLTAADAVSARVYAACYRRSDGSSGMVVAARFMDSDGYWANRNNSYAENTVEMPFSDSGIEMMSNPDSPYNRNRYHSCGTDPDNLVEPMSPDELEEVYERILAGVYQSKLWDMRSDATENRDTFRLTLNIEDPWTWEPFQIARLYRGYFNRQPDDAGWAYWQDAHSRRYRGLPDAPGPHLLTRLELAEVSEYFTQSEEFANTYGNALSSEEFITLVYQNVLGREPDDSGYAYWKTQMSEGLSRGEVMLWFSESQEFINATGPSLSGSCWNPAKLQESYLCAAQTIPDASAPGLL